MLNIVILLYKILQEGVQMAMVIKWTNIMSGEQGYVESVSAKEKHFINTFDKANAKVYKTAGSAKTAIKNLISYGEGEVNTFEIVEA